jgi:hypothetical protein
MPCASRRQRSEINGQPAATRPREQAPSRDTFLRRVDDALPGTLTSITSPGIQRRKSTGARSGDRGWTDSDGLGPNNTNDQPQSSTAHPYDQRMPGASGSSGITGDGFDACDASAEGRACVALTRNNPCARGKCRGCSRSFRAGYAPLGWFTVSGTLMTRNGRNAMFIRRSTRGHGRRSAPGPITRTGGDSLGVHAAGGNWRMPAAGSVQKGYPLRGPPLVWQARNDAATATSCSLQRVCHSDVTPRWPRSAARS